MFFLSFASYRIQSSRLQGKFVCRWNERGQGGGLAALPINFVAVISKEVV
jgi:hypothetical protein